MSSNQFGKFLKTSDKFKMGLSMTLSRLVPIYNLNIKKI